MILQTLTSDPSVDRMTTSFAIDKFPSLHPSQERSLLLRLQANSQISLTVRNPRPPSQSKGDRLHESRLKLEALEAKNRALSLVKNFNAYFWLSARMSVILTGIDVYRVLIAYWLSPAPGGAAFRSRPGWGLLAKPKKFGRYGRSQLHQCGGAWQLERFIPSDCLFVTGTLPGSTQAACETLARFSGQILNRLTQFIRRQGLLDWAWCWEQQKRGALHVHLILHCPDPHRRQWWLDNFRSVWYKILCDISDKSGVDLFERKGSGLRIKSWRNYPEKLKAEAEICRKNIAGYLAKYMGKTAAADKFAFDHNSVTDRNGKQTLKASQRNGFYSPSRWWGCSFHTKKLIKKYQQSYIISNSSDFIIEQFLELFDLLKPMSSGGTEWIDKTCDSYTKVLYHFPKYLGSAIDTYQFLNQLFKEYSQLVDFPRCSLEQRSLLERLADARQQDVEESVNYHLSMMSSRR